MRLEKEFEKIEKFLKSKNNMRAKVSLNYMKKITKEAKMRAKTKNAS